MDLVPDETLSVATNFQEYSIKTVEPKCFVTDSVPNCRVPYIIDDYRRFVHKHLAEIHRLVTANAIVPVVQVQLFCYVSTLSLGVPCMFWCTRALLLLELK